MAPRSELVTEPAPVSGEPSPGDADYRPPYRWAAAVGLGVFALYVLTLAPTTAFWDTSEYIATAHILGIPHPPGNPVFVILARAWELLLAPFPVSTAVKINLFSSANSAAAAAFWFLVSHRVLAFFSDEEMFRRIGAAGAAVISATAFTVWNQSVVNEKVYTVSLMTIALLTWLIFRWRDNLGRGKDDNLLILIVFLLALSVGNHLMAFLAAPALGLFVIWVHPRVLTRWRLYAFAGMAWVIGLSAQMFLPIRAAQDPIINEADPKCESVVDATVDVVTFGRAEACPALASSLKREQYRKPPLGLNPIFFPREVPRGFELTKWQFINYGQYFDWQWARGLDGLNHFFAPIRAPITLLFLLLGLVGAWRHYRADRTSWLYFATLFATVSAGLVIYLNFKYGYSVGATVETGGSESVPVPSGWREVRERDYFFIVSFSQWGVWAGVGLAAVWQTLGQRMAEGAAQVSPSDYLRSAPILAIAALPLLLNWSHASRAGDYAARDWAYNLLMSVEPYSVLFTNGDNDTFPLWYLQEVEGLRRDVTVIVYSYLATAWYARQLRDLTRPCGDDQDPLRNPTVIICQRPFEPDRAIDMYRGQDWRRPERPILQMSDADIANVPECYPVDRRSGRCTVFQDSMAFPVGDIVGFVAEGDLLQRNDILVLRILQSSAGDRPIYFASTTGTYERFHLQPYMIRRGVAHKLANREVEPGAGIAMLPSWIRFQGDRVAPFYLDLPRTEALFDEYYIFRDLTEKPFWPDHSTNGIPIQYTQALITLREVYLARDQVARAEEAHRRALEFADLALGRRTAPPAPSAQPRQPPSGDSPTETRVIPPGIDTAGGS